MLERTTHMKDKMLTYIGFAKKAGKLVAGSNACRFAMKKGRLKLLIIAEDASENTKNKMAGEAGSQGLPYKVYGYSDELSHTAGISGRMVFGITDDNFAKVITEQITES